MSPPLVRTVCHPVGSPAMVIAPPAYRTGTSSPPSSCNPISPPTGKVRCSDWRMTTAGGVAGRAATSSSDADTSASVAASTPRACSTATTESTETSTVRSSWSLYCVATPWAAARRARSGETVTGPVLPNRRLAMRPRLGGFELRGYAQQRHLVTGACDELDADRQVAGPIRRRSPVQRDRHGRLAAHVVRRGERREPLLVLEVLRGVVVVAQAPDQRRRLRDRRREDGVVRRGPLQLR